MLKTTALQQAIQQVGEVTPCSGCSMAKGIRTPTPHHTTSQAAAPMDMVRIEHRGTIPGTTGRLAIYNHVREQRFSLPAPIRNPGQYTSILSVVNRFVGHMGVPRAFRTDNGAEYTNSTFVDYCNGLGIHRELTALHTPQQNGPVESGLSRAIKAGHAARLEVNKLFPDVHLDRLKGIRDPDVSSL